jgi:hypothetical protein
MPSSLGRALVEQAIEVAADRGAGERQVLAHRGHVVPAFHRHRRRHRLAELAAERDDPIGARGIGRGDPSRPGLAELDTFRAKHGHHPGSDRGIGLGARRIGGEGEAALGSQAPEIGGRGRLRRAVRADEENGS